MFARPADFVIMRDDVSDPYLKRWYVIPRNPIFNIYLHKIMRSDEDRALHDHPWWNLSIALKGGYTEHTPFGSFVRRAGAVVFRTAKAAHRLEIHPSVAPHCWSLFLTGPRIRHWGFHYPKGWVHWKDFVDDTDCGVTGRGCGEP